MKTEGSPMVAAKVDTDVSLSVPIRNFAATPPADWRHILDQARAAEDAGIDRIMVFDHLVLGPDLSAYADPKIGGIAGGKQPTGPDGDWLDPLTVVGALAAVTNRVRLATNVLVAGLRHPVVLAKMTSTLDALSHGRFELGVGVGWQEAEYRAVGVPFEDRGRVLDEALAVCREFWTAQEASFGGRYVSFSGLHMMPKPVDPGGVPVWIGGRAIPAVARRVAKYGSGWIVYNVTPATIGEPLERMRVLVEKEGRDFGTVPLACHLGPVMTDSGEFDLPRMFEAVPKLRELGVRDFRAQYALPQGYDAAREFLEKTREVFDRLCA